MWDFEIIQHMLLITFLSIIIWLERELKNQPAGLRTHVLIWVWSALFMTISIMLPEIYWSNIKDPWRIAAQVVSWVWFIWAWAIMKMWLNTKWLTTAANIWVISAIWLAVWAWMYMVAIFVTGIILLNLILVTEIKERFLLRKKHFHVTIEFNKNKKVLENIMTVFNVNDVNIINKSIENNYNSKNTVLKMLVSSKWKIDSFTINTRLKSIKEIDKILIEEEN